MFIYISRIFEEHNNRNVYRRKISLNYFQYMSNLRF